MKKLIAVVGLVSCISGCAWYQKNQALIEEAARGACIVANAFLPDAKILEKCQLGSEFLALVERLAGEQRASVAKAQAAQKLEDEKAGVCKPPKVTMLYNSALQICMNDVGYTDLHGVTQ